MTQLNSCNPKGITTSHFGIASYLECPVAISRSCPPMFSGRHMLDFAPPWSIIKDIKRGKIEWSEYRELYLGHLFKNGITGSYVYEHVPHGSSLICYEPPGQHCHRRILAELIEYDTGFIVPEYNPNDDRISHPQIQFM